MGSKAWPAPRAVSLLLIPAAAATFLCIAIVQGQSLLGYDANIHLFFADHYLRSWWNTWEPRWYGGFDVVSYPPLAHQLLALLAAGIGLESASKVLSLGLVLAFPPACYAFARAFVGRRAAFLAAAVSLLYPAFALVLITDGQQPGVLSLELLLPSAAAVAMYIRGGRRAALLAAVLGVAAAAAAHHATPVLLGPFLGMAVAGRCLLASRPQGERVRVRLRRTCLVAALAVMAEAAVIWPFWAWWLHRPPQVPIDHFSRHNFILDSSARFLGLWLPYGLWLLVLPLLAVVAWRRRALLPAAVATVAIFVLSLGGTTPLPSWLYGSNWEWLTYERYALWAGPLLFVFAGWQLNRLGSIPALARNLGAVALATCLLATVCWAAWFSSFQMIEPQPLDLQPVAAFLDTHAEAGGRYLTLGFGDQVSRLSALTPASSVDGDYNTARHDPRLTGSGIEKLDSIRYWDPSGAALKAYLRQPDQGDLRWVLVNEPYYDRLLRASGWLPRQVLANGVAVWERPGAAAARPAASRSSTGIAAVWWGSVPLLAFVLALAAFCWNYLPSWGYYPQRRGTKLLFWRLAPRPRLTFGAMND